ncbi:MAG: hypothetical protein A2725_01915 [Candidatus Magasanikbacteria bacterium RIFCSPHIGHO2_01_FULL_33_34]|uniref:EfeO-type cupredoxin-like domain-containing protein n=1 Tax=Candidatus Magasanikbacteria bacterium RIFCSPHIGHO2_01_FULL_33_34 TaxID=1798671 RepID=A0A1F6LKW5_9BACT|nr:MAG: hypothetical protein A2725_01915 [Candidatus Magasanikbacteria bacterium RIFCSPHIGHO2_01_FULL_33_34]OGH65725.1 MAG: hypothetical protein A3B83_02420 [Candidatus Magasanikbacteria bacterium RIFCSPHIGHO2_02_FULL_33_17]OGH76338.1 MAG: hypothetical protein A3A89_03245 [Candidatus Magasanikbacteria bacterium RIFCSPLOWO2_01_FULL_33_34]OGH82482.1 MAG: hypothetical protein A3F93_03785 [Candidatus Magasanikbacteria bacterium RIFCSPLOWO2_12_FULL_34_7]
MQSKILKPVGFVGLLFGLTMVVGAGCNSGVPTNDEVTEVNLGQVVMDEDVDVDEMVVEDEVVMENKDEVVMEESITKEFSMNSFVVMEDGKPKPQFSVKNIEVKKGDKVKIKVTVTAGNHDFNIDEYEVHEKTPLNEEVVIEFTADKTGEFVYYCNMPGHRANGHWGTLTVVE